MSEQNFFILPYMPFLSPSWLHHYDDSGSLESTVLSDRSEA